MSSRNSTANKVLVTGVTGLVGRHVLYELLRESLSQGKNHSIYITVRNTEESADERVKALFKEGTCPDYLMAYSVELLMSRINIIPVDLRDENLAEQIHLIPDNDLYVIHSAACTNLASTEAVETEVLENNVAATYALMHATKSKAQKFIYISSSFAIGNYTGEIQDDYLNKNSGEFRNPYEKAKLEVENEVKNYCEENNLDWQILRPSVVCGRISDTPLYYVSKFDVFYGFAKCLAHFAKNKQMSNTIRIHCLEHSGLNIVPVDYVGKAITRAYTTPVKQLNIVHNTSVPVRSLVATICETVGFNNYEFVNKKPDDLNREERFYYNTAGAIFTNYLTSPVQWFNTKRLDTLMDNITPPNMLTQLPKLLDYAINSSFDKDQASQTAIALQSKTRSRRIVIIGSGYVAIHAYQSLYRNLRKQILAGEVELIILSSNNYQVFHGFIGEVIASVLPIQNIFTPIRQIFKHAKIIQGHVSSIDANNNTIDYKDHLENEHTLVYDEAILAAGSITDSKKVPGLQEFGWSIRKFNELSGFRHHMIKMVEQAQACNRKNDIEELLTFVVAGAGFSGVELCTAIAEFMASSKKDYPILEQFTPRLVLVHSGDDVLPEFHGRYQRLINYTRKQIQHHGIELQLNTRLVKVTSRGASLSTGEFVKSSTVLSTVGHTPVQLKGTESFEKDAIGRIKTSDKLNVLDHDNLWAGGDSANVTHYWSKQACPTNALWAIKHGQHIGKNLALKLKGKATKTFKFPGLGQAASFGGSRCIAELWGMQFTGWIAKVSRLGFFLYYMPSRRGAIQNMLEFSLNRLLGKKQAITNAIDAQTPGVKNAQNQIVERQEQETSYAAR